MSKSIFLIVANIKSVEQCFSTWLPRNPEVSIMFQRFRYLKKVENYRCRERAVLYSYEFISISDWYLHLEPALISISKIFNRKVWIYNFLNLNFVSKISFIQIITILKYLVTEPFAIFKWTFAPCGEWFGQPCPILPCSEQWQAYSFSSLFILNVAT